MRHVGGFDAVVSRYGVMVQGADKIALTMLDVLSYPDKIPVCVAYEADSKRINDFPFGETYAANSSARIMCCKKQSPPTSADGFYYWSR